MTDEFMTPEQWAAFKRSISGQNNQSAPQSAPGQIRPMSPEKKKEEINTWNGNPINKLNHIRAIDEDEERRKTRNSRVIWFIAFILLAGVLVFAYFSYYDAFKSNVICGNMSVTCEKTECTPCQSCGNVTCGCSLTCPGFPNNINVILKNQS